jgi:hypothetical protein
MPRKTKTKTKIETKEPVGPPPDASLLGIPPEMRNAIYRLVADDIDEVSIIGRKLRNNVSWWTTVAKHPLSQTCSQLRQEFDPIHQHHVTTTGAARYHLELEDYDVDAIGTFAKFAGSIPRAVRDQLKQKIGSCGMARNIIRFNLTKNVLASIHKLEKNWRELDSIFSKLQRAFDVKDYEARLTHEVNLNLNSKDRAMSPAMKKIAPTQNLLRGVKKDFKRISKNVREGYCWRYGEDLESVEVFEMIFSELEYTQDDYFRCQRWAREERGRKASEEHLESNLKARLRDELKEELKTELKEELKAEIMDELKDETEAELERQIQEGLEGWSKGSIAEGAY